MENENSKTKIAEALLTVQGKLTSMSSNEVNPFYHSRYTTLDHIWDTIRPLLQEAKIVVIQNPILEENKIGVETELIHTPSGETIKGRLLLPLTKLDPQGAGSAITYARRYSLCAMLGLTSTGEDDDGNATATPPTTETKRVSIPPTAAPAKPLDGAKIEGIGGVVKSIAERKTMTGKTITEYVIVTDGKEQKVSVWAERDKTINEDNTVRCEKITVSEFKGVKQFTAKVIKKMDVEIPF